MIQDNAPSSLDNGLGKGIHVEADTHMVLRSLQENCFPIAKEVHFHLDAITLKNKQLGFFFNIQFIMSNYCKMDWGNSPHIPTKQLYIRSPGGHKLGGLSFNSVLISTWK